MEKNNNVKTMIVAVIAVLMIGIIVAGGTYAWWSWSSNSANASENTFVNFVMETPTFKIVGTNVNGKKLAPTTQCYTATSGNEGYGYQLAGKATVTAENKTTTPMRTSFVLSAFIKPASGRSFASGDLAHVHWSIKEVAASNDAFSSSNCTGTQGATFDTGNFSSVGTSATNINTTITFDVAAGETATKYYQLYVWLDSGYNYENVGSNTVTDPMQDATVMLTFSTNSKFEQISS